MKEGEYEFNFFRHVWGVCDIYTHTENAGVGRSSGFHIPRGVGILTPSELPCGFNEGEAWSYICFMY